MSRQCPVVIGTDGEYSDTRVWVAAVCATSEDAAALAAACTAWVDLHWDAQANKAYWREPRHMYDDEGDALWAEALTKCPDRRYVAINTDHGYQPSSAPTWSVEPVLLWEADGESNETLD